MSNPIRSYCVRKNHEWAKIILEGGMITIHSTYGLFGHFFSDPGGDLRKFLIGCETGYYLGAKFSAGKREIDFGETEKAAKKSVCSSRRENPEDTTKEDARDAFDAISFDSELDVDRWLTDHGSVIDHDTSFVSSGYPQQLLAFFEVLWPVFIDTLKAELEQEKSAPAGRAASASQRRAVVERILAAWERAPEFRLGQLVGNLFYAEGASPMRGLLLTEDDELARFAENFAESRKAVAP